MQTGTGVGGDEVLALNTAPCSQQGPSLSFCICKMKWTPHP